MNDTAIISLLEQARKSYVSLIAVVSPGNVPELERVYLDQVAELITARGPNLRDMEDLVAELEADDYENDPWGAAIGKFFEVAEYLHFCTALSCPSEWEYLPGLGHDVDRTMFDDVDVTVLIAFGHYLDDLTSKLAKAGRDY